MIDKVFNIVLLIVISTGTLAILVEDQIKIKKIFFALILGCSLVGLGVALVYLFHGKTSVLEMLKLQKVYINGKFIIAGYGCLIGTILSLAFYRKSNKNK